MKKNKTNLIAIIFLGLSLIYVLKGAVYPTGIISMGVALLELILCVVFGILILKYKKICDTAKVLYILSFIIFITFLLSPKARMSQFGELQTFTFFREFCGAVLPFFGMYYITRKRLVTIDFLRNLFYLFYAASVIAFFYETVAMMVEMNKEFITSNAAYRFLYLMPFVVLLRGNYKVLILWTGTLIIALLSTKRGVIIGVTLELSIYYWWKFKGTKYKIRYIIVASLIIIIATHYLLEYYNDNVYLQMRVEDTLEGKTSGRDQIISDLLYYYSNTSIFKMIFGSGFVKTLSIAGNYAHNDWVEMLIDCGLIGFCVYGLFYISLLRSIIYTTQSSFKKVLILIFCAFFPTSFFSMVFFSESSSIGFLWLGFAIGHRDAIKFPKFSYETRDLFRFG